LLPHAHFVKVVPEADNFSGGSLGVGLVEDNGVCLLRGFSGCSVQIQFAFLFTLYDSTGDISWPRLDRGSWRLREANGDQQEEKHG